MEGSRNNTTRVGCVIQMTHASLHGKERVDENYNDANDETGNSPPVETPFSFRN